MARKKRAAKKKVTRRGAATAPAVPVSKFTDSTWDVDNGVLTCVFSDGNTTEQCQFIVKGPANNLSPEVKTKAMMHGICHRLKTSRDPKVLVGKLLAGEWPAGRAAAGAGRARISRPIIAYARVLRNTDATYAQYTEDQVIDMIAQQWKGWTQDVRDVVLDDWRVKLEIKRLTLEAQGGEADLASLLTTPPQQQPAPQFPQEPVPQPAPSQPAPAPQPPQQPVAATGAWPTDQPLDPSAPFGPSPFGPMPGDGSGD